MTENRTVQTQAVRKLPLAARRLIEKNKQSRIGSKKGGDFHGRLEKTVSYLRWRAACNSLSDAIGYIASELERERLYGLYRRLFPKEWKSSRASFQRTGYSDCHTEREIEFIELVSERYFPLCSWLDWSDFRFDHIPIESVNYDFCCDEYEWQHFRPCLQFALSAFLWTDTDIDTTYCQPLDLYELSFENLEKLKSDYAGVKVYFESLDSLDEDITRDALSAFKELITIWNTGRLPTNKRQREATEKADKERGLLINILADYENQAEAALTF